MSAAALDTLIVGAGISGLTFAHERMRLAPHENLLLLEAADRAGGLVRTFTQDGFRFEGGPEALPSGARSVRELCQELGLPLQEVPPAAARRYLALDGKLRDVPASPTELATSRLLSFGGKLRLLAEASSARDVALDGSIAAFARHRFGQEALERVIEPLVAGIHAGDPEQLSLRACFPEVVQLVAEHGSLTAALKAHVARKPAGEAGGPLGGTLLRPAGGMESVVTALARGLGAHLCTNVAVTAVRRGGGGFTVDESSGASHRASRVVLALPLAATRTLLVDAAPDAAAALATMQAESLISVAHAYRRVDVAHALDGLGYLVPRSAGGLVLGTLFSSTLDPGAAPAGHVLLRSLLGGARRPDALQRGDEELLDEVTRECSGLLGLAGAPVFTHVARYRSAIPRLDLEHLTRRERLAAGLPPGLAVLGSFTRGPGLASLVAEACALARGL